MAKYRSLDGVYFIADSFEELAHKLWESQFIPPPTIEQWMQGSAKRAYMWNKAKISTATVDEHIADLILHGFVEEVQ